MQKNKGDIMKVSEAIKIQKNFISGKYHNSDIELKESMKVLTKAYDELWNYLEEKELDTLDRFIKYLIESEEK